MNLSLQRRLSGDCSKWRTVHRFNFDDAGLVLDAAQQMGRVGEPIEFRIVKDDGGEGAMLYWSREAGWECVGEV